MLKGSRKFRLIQPMARLICCSLLSASAICRSFEACSPAAGDRGFRARRAARGSGCRAARPAAAPDGWRRRAAQSSTLLSDSAGPGGSLPRRSPSLPASGRRSRQGPDRGAGTDRALSALASRIWPTTGTSTETTRYFAPVVDVDRLPTMTCLRPWATRHTAGSYTAWIGSVGWDDRIRKRRGIGVAWTPSSAAYCSISSASSRTVSQVESPAYTDLPAGLLRSRLS